MRISSCASVRRQPVRKQRPTAEPFSDAVLRQAVTIAVFFALTQVISLERDFLPTGLLHRPINPDLISRVLLEAPLMGLMVGLVEIAGRASLALVVTAAALAAGRIGRPRRSVLLALAPASLLLILLQVYAPPHYADRPELREDGNGSLAIALDTWVRFTLATAAAWSRIDRSTPRLAEEAPT